MDTVDLIIKSSTKFYNDLKVDENGRYRSWEHCYSHFIKARESKEVDYDYLSLQLIVRKAHSFRCGMDSTFILYFNVYVSIDFIHIL